jgi:tRNA(Ile)-lysidine synthase
MEFIRRHELFAGAGRILLAVSGGADSVALLHLLVSLRTEGWLDAELVCAHINHKLRGPAGDDDERFVMAQAEQAAVPVVTRAVDVRTYAEARKLSVETAGRQLRLAGLDEMAREQNCTWVATGHQKDDNAETVVHRLRRGTGFRGLVGIRPRRPMRDDLWLARPLLCATRDEIVRYLEERKLPWREDRTNADLTYTRNLIRHRLLPALQRECRCRLVEELSDLAASAGRLDERIRREAETAQQRLVRSAAAEVAIDAAGLASLPDMVAVELVRQALARLGCGERNLVQQHYRDILRLARPCRGGKSVSLPGGFAARREQQQVIIGTRGPAPARRAGPAPPESPAAPAPVTLAIPGRVPYAGGEIEAKILDRRSIAPGEFKANANRLREYFDLDRLRPPVIVRSRQAGDRFQPLGLGGVKKVGKFLTTARVSPEQRTRILVFADREKIIWLCPIRIGEQAKVTPATRRVLCLTVTRPRLPGHRGRELPGRATNRADGRRRRSCQNSQMPPMQPPA